MSNDSKGSQYFPRQVSDYNPKHTKRFSGPVENNVLFCFITFLLSYDSPVY